MAGSDEHWSAFVASADQLEEGRRFSLIFGQVGKIIEHQQMIFVEFGDRALESELAAGDLERLAHRDPALTHGRFHRPADGRPYWDFPVRNGRGNGLQNLSGVPPQGE